jgi:tRNA pseudouridine32 synthase / 23S rRNA pseudouridine746 synthase
LTLATDSQQAVLGQVRLIHADASLLVLDKPADLLSVPGRGAERADCLSARVQQVWPDALVVHRLDMATSGLLVMARGLAAQQALSRAFAQRLTHKRYQAVVWGVPPVDGDPDAEGWRTMEWPLVVDWPNRPRSKVCHTTGKPSTTRWKVLETDPQARTTRLWLEPVTGRSHQLRVHLLTLGHPILGDNLYAPPEALAASQRLLLHASELALPHPQTGETMRWHSPVPF